MPDTPSMRMYFAEELNMNSCDTWNEEPPYLIPCQKNKPASKTGAETMKVGAEKMSNEKMTMLSVRVPEPELERLNALTPANRRSELIREAVVNKLDEIESASIKRIAEEQVKQTYKHGGKTALVHLTDFVKSSGYPVMFAVARRMDRPTATHTHEVGIPGNRADFSAWMQMGAEAFLTTVVKPAGAAVLYADIKRVMWPQVPVAEAFEIAGEMTLVTDTMTLSNYKFAAEQQQALQDAASRATPKRSK